MRKIFSAFLILFSCIALSAQDLVILHTNDTHSHVEPIRSGVLGGRGGVVERAAFIDSVRTVAGAGNVLLVDAGDFSQGTSYFTELHGDIEIELINAMRYDVVCLGNHEFDNGLDELARRLSSLNCPVVCSNYIFSGSALSELVKPYTILYRSGLKIGFVGVLTDLSSVVDGDIATRMTYCDPAESVTKWAKYLKEECGCDLVICLSHLGIEKVQYTDQVMIPQTEGLDMVIGGHSHTLISEPVYVEDKNGRPVPVVTDWYWGLNVGMAKISVPFKSKPNAPKCGSCDFLLK